MHILSKDLMFCLVICKYINLLHVRIYGFVVVFSKMQMPVILQNKSDSSIVIMYLKEILLLLPYFCIENTWIICQPENIRKTRKC